MNNYASSLAETVDLHGMKNALWNTINKYCKSIIFPFSDRQVHDYIHCILFEHIIWNNQWLQDPWQLWNRHLGSLTNLTSSYLMMTSMIHAFPPVMFSQCLHHAIWPQVADQRTVMMCSQQITAFSGATSTTLLLPHKQLTKSSRMTNIYLTNLLTANSWTSGNAMKHSSTHTASWHTQKSHTGKLKQF